MKKIILFLFLCTGLHSADGKIQIAVMELVPKRCPPKRPAGR